MTASARGPVPSASDLPAVEVPAPARTGTTGSEAPASARVKPALVWATLKARAQRATPEAFSPTGDVLNLTGGAWRTTGRPRRITSPVDGSTLGHLPMLDLAGGLDAVRAARAMAPAWAGVPLAQRTAKVAATLDAMRTQRELLASLLLWEIGKPWHLALTDVDRCIEGVAWYVEQIGPMLGSRQPLGLVSNIASWNYPLSVLMHAVLVQALCGNAVIAKSPTDGGGITLAVCMALAHRAGLPVSYVSGSGGELSPALVRNDSVDCLAFVGGRSIGREIAASLVDTGKRHMLEMEGVNAYGVWEFSDWATLAQQVRKGFEYGKQRCTAYPRFVVQRRLLPAFLDMYLGVVRTLRVGHPALVLRDDDPAPTLDFGPLINAAKVDELQQEWNAAVGGGALPIFQGSLDASRLLPGQDASAYLPPRTLLAPPRSCGLYHSEPFGPIDTIVVVDRLEELVAEMNVSNGNLVSSLATDDPALARRVGAEVRAFKFGHNALRSRGDRDELFGGLGQSWKGCFVGGALLVKALTIGPDDATLPGVFSSGTRLPAV